MCRIFPFLIFSLLSLVACSNVPRMEKPGIVAYGFKNGEPLYDNISVDVEKSPGKVIPLFCVKLSSTAEPLRTDQLTESTVSEHLPEFQIPEYWPDLWKKKALENKDFEGNGFYILFKNGSLKSLGMGTRQSDPIEPITKPVSPARIGPADCRTLYTLPITREQFVEIFGEPNREYMVREVYY